MRLIRFTTTNDVNVLVNPDTVMCVYDTDDGVWIAFGNDCSYHVQGTIDEVAAKLMGEPLAEEPERWVPKKGEKYWLVDITYEAIRRSRWAGDIVDMNRTDENRVFPYTPEGLTDAGKRLVSALEGK